MYARLKAEGKEGIVFKRLTAPYTPGRPASGGDQFKFKFVDACTCVVLARNAKRSVEIGLIDDEGKQVSVGNCTIGPNRSAPGLGSLIEVRYLYAHRGGFTHIEAGHCISRFISAIERTWTERT